MFPSVIGAHSWQPMAYSPKTGLVYLPTLEAGNIIYDATPAGGYRPSLFNANVGFAFMPGIEANRRNLPPAVQRAIDAGILTKGMDLRRARCRRPDRSRGAPRPRPPAALRLFRCVPRPPVVSCSR
jgi:quinohemoprotein ethanol dehydrogenase